jgi:hypothetical protein
MYEGCADSLEEYLETVWQRHGRCDVENYAKVPQPVYTAHNYYGDGVAPYERDRTSPKSALASNAKITEEADGVYLEMTLDSSFDDIRADVVTTESLGLPRITECPFDAPDGSDIKISQDIFGAQRGKNPTPGAIEGVKAGKVKVKIW